MTLIDEYAQRVEDKIDHTNFLGRLFWYALSEMRVPHATFAKMLIDIGIETGHPNPPKDVDVFRRVCAGVKYQRVPTADPDVFENFTMVEFHNKETVTKRVVRERINNAGKTLKFTELFDVVFDREDRDLVVKPIGGPGFKPGGTAERIRDEIIDGYYQWRDCLDAQAIRSWFRSRIIDSYNATMVRPGGGIYFMNESHLSVLEGIEAIGAKLQDYVLSEGGKVEFHTLPLIDDTKQREMVQRAFEAETVDAIDSLLTEITELTRKGGVVSQDKFLALFGQYQDLTGKTEEYQELLENKLDATGARLAIFQASLLKLKDQVK